MHLLTIFILVLSVSLALTQECSNCKSTLIACNQTCWNSVERCAVCLGLNFDRCHNCINNSRVDGVKLYAYFKSHSNFSYPFFADNCCEAANGGCCWGSSKCSICCKIGVPAICSCIDCPSHPTCDCATCSSCASCYCGRG